MNSLSCKMPDTFLIHLSLPDNRYYKLMAVLGNQISGQSVMAYNYLKTPCNFFSAILWHGIAKPKTMHVTNQNGRLLKCKLICHSLSFIPLRLYYCLKAPNEASVHEKGCFRGWEFGIFVIFAWFEWKFKLTLYKMAEFKDGIPIVIHLFEVDKYRFCK